MSRPRWHRQRIRRGDGFTTEVAVITKPELGERVRVLHRTDVGQYVFDYSAEEAAQLADDLKAASAHALTMRRQLQQAARAALRSR